jgi:endoplasmic reticulum resident protein 44
MFFSAENEFVFVNFYADWCRFSNMLAPIWDEAADKVAAEFPDAGRVLIGKVDCDKESKNKYFFLAKRPTSLKFSVLLCPKLSVILRFL